MLQVVQNYKTGELKVLEIPIPGNSKNRILVRNFASVISSGTEAMKIEQAKMSLIEKAKARPDHLKAVVDNIKKEGLLNTYNKVMRKLDSFTPLGYSCAGEVTEVGEEVFGFKVGDRVACGGQGAFHAEMVSVFPNLCVKISDNVSYQEAAYTTIGAIAMQGFRRAEVGLGENVAVIGLGLIGQITVQLLKASGCKVIASDLEKKKMDIALDLGCDCVSSSEDMASNSDVFSGGKGVDSVIITASTNSLEPVETAGKITKKRGRVVIVGAVPTGFSRENYYKKELELKMAASYGPGRYDSIYEEKGVDYPFGYVRWTENRNMQAFVELLFHKRIDLKAISTHSFKLEEAHEAYELINKKKDLFLGITLIYDSEKGKVNDRIKFERKESTSKEGAVKIGFIGAGSFAQNYLLPHLKKMCNVELVMIHTETGLGAVNAGARFGFNEAVSSAEEVINSANTNCVMIATRHDSHAEYVKKALKAGKHVYTEKPLALNRKDLSDTIESYRESKGLNLAVGFNRRFSPSALRVKGLFSFVNEPLSILMRINAGDIPPEHWIQDPEKGGGRILGEVCHFIDLARFWAGVSVNEVFAQAFPAKGGVAISDSLHINLKYKNGSVATIIYTSGGPKNISKEYYEVFGAGKGIILDDFKEIRAADGKKKKVIRGKQDKGYKQEMESFVNAVINGKEYIHPEEIFESTEVAFLIQDSIRKGENLKLEI